MHVCKRLNQTVRIIECNGKYLKGVSKKNYIKRLSFITQFKRGFLLPLTGYGKVLGKMSALLCMGS